MRRMHLHVAGVYMRLSRLAVLTCREHVKLEVRSYALKGSVWPAACMTSIIIGAVHLAVLMGVRDSAKAKTTCGTMPEK